LFKSSALRPCIIPYFQIILAVGSVFELCFEVGMKHGKVSFLSSAHYQKVSENEIHTRDPSISQTYKQYKVLESPHRMPFNSFGLCCDLPAVLSGASCSFDYCKHCIYSGETDDLKRAHGLGSCTWHLLGKTHIGTFAAGIPCGWGTRTWDDGVIHEGFWQGHKLNGRGVIAFVDGSTYHGMLVDSIRTGHGTYRSASGFSYDGCWQNDKPHGHGQSSDHSKDIKYSGDWEFGFMHGHGVMTILESNGASRRYEGSFVHGMREGHGVERSEHHGTSYNGSWLHNLRHGIGTETISGKGVYVGQWKDDLRHGAGVYKSSNPNKCHYEGEWQDGLRHGRAIVRWNAGDSFACNFVKGKMVGPGILRTPASSAFHRQGATLLVHSDAIHTANDGCRASAKLPGLQMFFLLPARKITSSSNK
jgi:hypothetical protein